MSHERFEKLEVWVRSIEMVDSVYRVTRRFPADEKSGLAATLRRTATAIPAKIADADGHEDTAKTCQAFTAVRGPVREMQTYAVIARRLGFLSYFKYTALRRRLRKIDRLLDAEVELLTPQPPKRKPAEPALRRAA